MISLLLINAALAAPLDTPLLSPEGRWVVVNDGVMGGRSRSAAEDTDEGLRFSGFLSLANGGGFASIRHATDGDLSSHDAIEITVRGDGRRYQFRMRPGRGFDGIAWRAEFVAPAEWSTIHLPLADFEPVYRGRRVPRAGPVPRSRIGQIGFLIADGTHGPFRLDVRALQAITLGGESR